MSTISPIEARRNLPKTFRQIYKYCYTAVVTRSKSKKQESNHRNTDMIISIQQMIPSNLLSMKIEAYMIQGLQKFNVLQRLTVCSRISTHLLVLVCPNKRDCCRLLYTRDRLIFKWWKINYSSLIHGMVCVKKTVLSTIIPRVFKNVYEKNNHVLDSINKK